MSSFKRLTKAALTACALGLLTACGFTPLAALEDGSGARGYSISDLSITVSDPDFSYELRKYFDLRVKTAAGAPDKLAVTVLISSENIAVRQDDTVTRVNITATAQYRLIGPDGKVVKAGSLTSITAINSSTDFFATGTSRREAKALLAKDIGRKLIAVLYARRLALKQ